MHDTVDRERFLLKNYGYTGDRMGNELVKLAKILGRVKTMLKKKSFVDKDNPALRFLSAVNGGDSSDNECARETEHQEKSPVGRCKPNPLYVETKSRRLQLMLQPSVYNRIRANAHASGLSVNEYCHQILDNATNSE